MQSQDRLEDEGGFPDTRFSAEEYQASRHQSATEHTIQFLIVHIDARLFASVDVVQGEWLALGRLQDGDAMLGYGRFLAHHLFGVGVPLSARRAFAHPFGRVLSAMGTNIYGFLFGHSFFFTFII